MYNIGDAMYAGAQESSFTLSSVNDISNYGKILYSFADEKFAGTVNLNSQNSETIDMATISSPKAIAFLRRICGRVKL